MNPPDAATAQPVVREPEDASARGPTEAVRHGREACAEHYVPTHLRVTPRTCPSCGGAKAAADDRCRRCRARR